MDISYKGRERMNTQHSGSTGEEKGRMKDPQIYVDHFIDHVSQQLNLEKLIALIEPKEFSFNHWHPRVVLILVMDIARMA